ncbi:MAG: hypothetical protein ACK5P5_13985 [Pseudobdellovibrionaceae bacterium]
MTQNLHDLIQIPEASRDHNWEEKFFFEFAKSNVEVANDSPQTGPDGWPYLILQTGDQSEEPAQKIIQWAAERGIGLVLNPTKEYPDYVFTYGMLWNFRKTGRFLSAQMPKMTNLSKFEVNTEKGFYSGHPTEDYFPDYARKVLRDFFADQKIKDVKILLISSDNKNFDLVFSLESLGVPPTLEHQGILEAISWFMPPHYSLALMSEKGLPPFALL